MFEAIDLEDCLIELAPYVSWTIWSVDNVEAPVRDIKPIAWVQPSPLEAPDATIYGVTLVDGSMREVLVGGDPRHRNFDDACFLKPGRTGQMWADVADFVIGVEEEVVPQNLKDAIRDFESDRAANSAAPRNG